MCLYIPLYKTRFKPLYIERTNKTRSRSGLFGVRTRGGRRLLYYYYYYGRKGRLCGLDPVLVCVRSGNESKKRLLVLRRERGGGLLCCVCAPRVKREREKKKRSPFEERRQRRRAHTPGGDGTTKSGRFM